MFFSLDCCRALLIFVFRCTTEEKLTKLERTLDKAVASLINPASRIDTEHQVRPPTAEITQGAKTVTSHPEATCHGKSSGVAGAPSDIRYQYLPLRDTNNQTSHGSSRPLTATTNQYRSDSANLIKELGLDSTVTSPPRRYNPPPEKLDPSPHKGTAGLNPSLVPVRGMKCWLTCGIIYLYLLMSLP